MKIALESLASCFQGLIPATLYTCSKAGVPNVALLSHVEYVDSRHVALSFQFFNKSRRNIAENPLALVRVFDPDTLQCYEMELRYVRSESSGALFDSMSLRIEAIASHSGLKGIFKLIAADVYEVLSVAKAADEIGIECPATGSETHASPADDARFNMKALQEFSDRIHRAPCLEGLLDSILESLENLFGFRNSLPFVSNLPSKVEIHVEPAFGAVVDGAPLALTGKARPFSETKEAQIEVNLDGLDLPKYAAYSPVPLNFALPSGKLDGRLTVTFSKPRDGPPSLHVAGSAGLERIELSEKGGAPVLKLPALTVSLKSLDVFGGRAEVDSVNVQNPELWLRRGKDGQLSVLSLLPKPPAQPADKAEPKPAAKPAAPFRFSVADTKLAGAKVQFRDEAVDPAFEARVDALDLTVKNLSNAEGQSATVELGLKTAAGEAIKHTGTLTLAPLAAKGRLELAGLKIPNYASYYRDKVLFGPHCPRCGEPVAAQRADEMAVRLIEQAQGAVAVIAAPVARGRKGGYRKELVDNWLDGQGGSYMKEEYRQHPNDDAYWAEQDLFTRLDVVRTPIYHVGGWYDIFYEGSVRASSVLQDRAATGARWNQKLRMGPWTHGTLGLNVAGDATYPLNALDVEAEGEIGRAHV